MAPWRGRGAEVLLEGLGPGALQRIMTPQAPFPIGIIEPLTESDPTLHGPGRVLTGLQMQPDLIVEKITGQAPGPDRGSLFQGPFQPAIPLRQAQAGSKQHTTPQTTNLTFTGLSGCQQQGRGLLRTAKRLEMIGQLIESRPLTPGAGGRARADRQGDKLQILLLERSQTEEGLGSTFMLQGGGGGPPLL